MADRPAELAETADTELVDRPQLAYSLPFGEWYFVHIACAGLLSFVPRIHLAYSAGFQLLPCPVIPMRFLLIDRITDLRPGESITAIKNVSLAEEYLQDHFPGFPILPGVMMVECLTQAGAWLMRYTENFAYSTILLKEAKAVKFNNFVAPGKSIQIECSVHKREGNLYTFKASGTCGDTNVVSARMVLEQSNLADSNPRLAPNDETQREFFRTLSEGLWTPPAA